MHVKYCIVYFDCQHENDRLCARLNPTAPGSSRQARLVALGCVQQWGSHSQICALQENHLFSGVPMHFSTSDIKTIRGHLLASQPIIEYCNIKKDDAIFTVVVKVFPLANGFTSVWTWTGVQVIETQNLPAMNTTDELAL
eukprot:570018-Amphidinium_carterae.1